LLEWAAPGLQAPDLGLDAVGGWQRPERKLVTAASFRT
jgi:hypothetical protein